VSLPSRWYRAVLHPKTAADLRITVFLVWIAFAFLLTAIPLLLRICRPVACTPDQALQYAFSLTGLWLPALSCFAAFWFADRPRAAAHISAGQRLATLALTGLYVAICWAVVGFTLFPSQQLRPDGLPMGRLPAEQLAYAVGWLQGLSPVCLAPIAYLTGHVPPRASSASSPAGG
jgi:hypothetical protein